jgi:ABC-2 type transport system ATP-binding protein
VTQAAMSELTSGSSVLVRVSDPTALERALRAAGATVTAHGTDGLSVTGVAQEQVGETAATRGLVVYELTTRGTSLEDIFLHLTEEGDDDAAR